MTVRASLSDPEADIENVQNQIDDGVCHAEVTVTDEAGTARVLHSTNQVGDACLCLAFSEVGCVQRTRRVDGDSLLIETYVSDRSVISELVDPLQSAAKRARLLGRGTRPRRREDAVAESSPRRGEQGMTDKNPEPRRGPTVRRVVPTLGLSGATTRGRCPALGPTAPRARTRPMPHRPPRQAVPAPRRRGRR